MARHNNCFLFGAVTKPPSISIDKSSGKAMGICFLTVVRGPRAVGDHRRNEKFDQPVIIAQTDETIEQMKTWQSNDIVFVKGSVATKKVMKTSTCPTCNHKNSFEGVLVCFYPIWSIKVASMATEDEARNWLIENKEVSNQVYSIGRLARDPKKISPKSNLVVTQYPIAVGRKYHFTQDPPEVNTDFPWVKSYGQNAVSDRERLKVGSEVYIDGCIQARNVMRHADCPNCGTRYDWKDKAMEIVPFETEYLSNYYSDEEVAENIEKRAEQSKNDILRNAKRSKIEIPPDTEDEISDEDIESGFDPMGEDSLG